MEERYGSMPKPRKIVDAGPFTIDLRNLEYMERVTGRDDYGPVHGIKFVFYSGAHRTAWYGWKSGNRDAVYSSLTKAFQDYHG